MTAPVIAREEQQAMEFSVTKSALLNELSTTQGVVERKTTIPILSNLLVEAKGSQLTITATDLELSIRTSCEAKVKKEGAGTSEFIFFDASRAALAALLTLVALRILGLC